MVIVQIIVKQLNLAELDQFSDITEEQNFLAFAKGPFMLIILQTHFNVRYKRLV